MMWKSADQSARATRVKKACTVCTLIVWRAFLPTFATEDQQSFKSECLNWDPFTELFLPYGRPACEARQSPNRLDLKASDGEQSWCKVGGRVFLKQMCLDTSSMVSDRIRSIQICRRHCHENAEEDAAKRCWSQGMYQKTRRTKWINWCHDSEGDIVKTRNRSSSETRSYLAWASTPNVTNSCV